MEEQPISSTGVIHHALAWRVFDQLSDAQFQDCRQAGIDALQAQLLYNRGIKTTQAMRAFLDARYDKTPDPLSLIDMPGALERIQRALTQREHITIYGDYDADGVTSAALLTRALRTLGHPADLLDYHIPHRLSDGRGLNINTLDMLKSKGTSLLITTDCASSDIEQVAHARMLDIDVIITDHHHPPEPRPDAYAMINPWCPDCTYGERYLCGVGIAFKLAQALYRAYSRSAEEHDLLDLVAIGTIADIAPLLGENHTLVRLGLEQLRHTRKPGLLALIRKANLQQDRLRERDISYALAPRINAAGRMKDASLAFELLTTDDDEQASRYADELEALNVLRQQQTETLINAVREEIERRPNDPVVLVSGDDWPEGIIGLVAGKLVEELHRPIFVLSKGPQYSRGSARSSESFNLILALRAQADLFVRYGGHAQAAGFTIANERIEELRSHLLSWHRSGQTLPIRFAQDSGSTGVMEQSLRSAGAELAQRIQISSAPTSDNLGDVTLSPSGSILPDVLPTLAAEVPEIVIEPEQTTRGNAHMIELIFTKPERLKYSTYSKVQQLAPFGAANPEPVFKLTGLRLLSCWVSGMNGRHLRMRLAGGGVRFNGIFIQGGALLPSFAGVKYVNVIFRLEPAWNPTDGESKQDINLRILDVEIVRYGRD
jgi:single-stranded-DNA-specific exonuclease